jgi:hypothetical protein
MKILREISLRCSGSLAILIGLGVFHLGAGAATAADLRWLPSVGSDVVGYKLYVGSETGFFAADQVDRIVDIGSDFVMNDGVASHPLENLITGPSWVVLTAYDGAGNESSPSNQLLRDLPATCTYDSDCLDGTVCNGQERCDGGVCTGGTALQCDTFDPCNIGRCDAVNGCATDPAPDGAVCNDGDARTEGDRCEAGSCTGSVVEVPLPADYVSPEPTGTAFDLVAIGQDPPGWFDTGAFNSLAEDDLFEVMQLPSGEKVFGTRSDWTNIHSHLLADGSRHWSGYEVNGRMRVSMANGGIGVTLYSDYSNADAYYRLRRFDAGSFHLAPHGVASNACQGVTDTGVTPSANTWYHFRFRAFEADAGTRVQAKVWSAGSTEPGGWQADCLDASSGRRLGGAPGVWSMGFGEKYWDDLAVAPLQPATGGSPPEQPECGFDADCDDADMCTGTERCVEGSCVAGSMLACGDPGVCGVAACYASTGCVIEPSADGTVCGSGDFCTAAATCFDGTCTAGASLSCPDPGECLVGRCDPESGCRAARVPDGSLCDDGNSSTTQDVCSAGVCTGTMLPPPPAGEETPPTEEEPVGEYGRLRFDFEDITPGESPPGWLDTKGKNSLDEGDAFRVFDYSDGNHVFGTKSTQRNVHSHYVDYSSIDWYNYEFRGLMLTESKRSGIGVTLYSDYPNSDSYYRLRQFHNEPFHLANHPHEQVPCDGVTTTSVVPNPNTWYAFRFQAFDVGMTTRLRAKVWSSQEPEPEQWQIDCVAPEDNAYFSGSPGVWSLGRGGKFWDDLEVISLETAQPR